jgi:hypothetical protein
MLKIAACHADEMSLLFTRLVSSTLLVTRMHACMQATTTKSSSLDSQHQLQGPAREVLRTIYRKWQRQIQRWADYRSLFSLIAFIAVFLGVLYAQRGATVGYQVHSTIASVAVPGSKILQSTADVYSWLQGLLQVRAG